ncbi:serine/threonine-protein kinase [Streptosporangium amethystogenes subsp. fukuiense]|uniref:Serine/threonine-protein kinase n=1 Tax=Streptosporangium amethystogenes subsp. fukuiense TaxID=698418 RepID=A0ABW2T3N1_9ACTN
MLPLAPADPGQINAFRLSGVLGRGGQGSVYLGQDAAGAKVAVKVLHARMEDAETHRRFIREAEAARRVAPFCTARVLDVGVADGRPYIVSEFVAGPSLERLVRGEGVRFGSGLERLAVTTLTALAAIHRAGIVHRDFKPSNVIMGAEGPVVIDFGIARALDQTATSSVMGTPAFMAPEQFAGVVGPAADLFSWAGTMVFAATGQQAFTGDTMPALMHAILTTEPNLSGVPEGLRPLLARCLAKDPAARPGTEELLGLLTRQGPGAAAGSWPAPDRPAPPRSGTLLLPGPGSQATGSRAHSHAPQPVASVVALVLMTLLALTLFAQGLDFLAGWVFEGHRYLLSLPVWIMVSMGCLIPVVPAFCAAVWRHSVASAISMALVIPLALLFLFWGLVLGAEDDLPEVLVAIVPAVLLGVVVAAAALLLWRLNAFVAVLGGIGGLLMSVETVGHFVDLMPGPTGRTFKVLMIVVLLLTRFTLGAWLMLLGGMLTLRAVQSRGTSGRGHG